MTTTSLPKVNATKVKESHIEIINRIVTNHQAEKIDDILVDATSANAYKTVYDNLSEANQKNLLSQPIAKAISICWRLIK